MRVLVVSHSCATAENQKVFAALAATTGWEVTLIVPDRWKDEFGNFLAQPAVEGLRVIRVPVVLNGSIILHFYRLQWRKFLEQGAYDIIYMQHEPYALATAQVLRANARCARPSAFGFYSCQNIAKTYPFPFSLLERQVYLKSSFALPITESVGRVLRGKGFDRAVTICPLPVDTNLCRPRGKTSDHELLPRARGEVVLGFVGRLVEAKGLTTLAGALAEISDLPWRLVLVGTGPMRSELEKIFSERGLMGRVHFAGYVPHGETPRYLSAMDILVLPSETRPGWKEQFGRVIPEAMACGTCVVGSDSGEIPEIIRSSGGGEIFPEGRSADLAQVLCSLIKDESRREMLADKGAAWVSENLSLTAVAAKLTDTFQLARNRISNV